MDHLEQRSAVLANVDVRNLKGLEIGPRQNPIVRKSDGFVLYVDRAVTASVKESHREPPSKNDVHCETDIVWGECALKDLVPHPMDYVVADDVVEHVPDMIGWLMDLHGALTDDGLICLVVPDRRFTFDLRRPESTAGEMVEAFLLRASRPPARHVFDQVSLQAAFSRVQGWEDDMLVQAPPLEKHLPCAHQLAERIAATDDYVDAHCWVFTPESFLEVAGRLSRIGLFPFAIEHFHPTEYGHYEFYARLRKSQDPGVIAASLENARELLKNSLTEHAYREMLLEKVYEQKLPESCYLSSLREMENMKRRIKDELRVCENDVRYYRSLLEEVQTSTSWRLTWPVRWLGRVLQSAWLTRKFLYAPFHRSR